MKIIQFGTGRFLRGFFDPIVSEPKSVTVVQSRSHSDGADLINAQPDGYHVWTRGKKDGETVDSFELVKSIDRALVANRDWKTLIDLAVDADTQLIVSNTTAAGLQLDESDRNIDYRNQCPESFPAKILALLHFRFERSQPGLTVLPLELVENNASTLFSLVSQQAHEWNLSEPAFLEWLRDENRWLNNLVDRIVVSPSDLPPWQGSDSLAVVGEPFRMLAIEDDGKGHSPIPKDKMIIWEKDLSPFFLRKVRILNGLHTAMVAKFLPEGYETVLECVSKPESRAWIECMLEQEILPALASRGLDETAFARDVIERFENPFFEHKLSDIANGHETKLAVRIQPTIDDFTNAFSKEPPLLSEVINRPVADLRV